MTRLLYDIEDYLDDAAHGARCPRLLRRLIAAVGRTVGGAGDIVARRQLGL